MKKIQIALSAGVEKVLVLATNNSNFKEELFADGLGAVEKQGIELNPSEKNIISAIGESHLQSVIESIDLSIRNLERRRFLKEIFGASIALTTLQSCMNDDGSKPDFDMNTDESVDTSQINDIDPNDKIFAPLDHIGFMPDAGVRPPKIGNECKSNNECDGKSECVEINSKFICSIECYPDDPKTPMIDEDTCPMPYNCTLVTSGSKKGRNYCAPYKKDV